LLEPEWDRRRHEILAWFDRLDPDVVCLQEVWEDGTTPNTAGWLVEHAGRAWHWCFGGFPFPAELWADRSMRFGSAILSRWPIDHHELVALPVDDSARAGADAYYRLEFELLHARTAGIDVFSTHLAPPPAQAYHRIREVLLIDDVVRDRADPSASLPPILCGDFNAEPHSDELRMLTGQAAVPEPDLVFRDAWTAPGVEGPGYTWADANPYAKVEHEMQRRIDYVFSGWRRNDGRGAPLTARVVGDEPIDGVWPSDHFGVLAELQA
jgi:endonuclease/exonuclease/phosphatase family metal-dependent hydrolase